MRSGHSRDCRPETFRAPPLSGCCRFARRNHVSPVRATPSLDRSDKTMWACGLSGFDGPSTPPDAPPPCTAGSPPGSAAARTPAPPRAAACGPARWAARSAPRRTDARWPRSLRRPPASSLAHPQRPTTACCRARRAPPRPHPCRTCLAGDIVVLRRCGLATRSAAYAGPEVTDCHGLSVARKTRGLRGISPRRDGVSRRETLYRALPIQSGPFLQHLSGASSSPATLYPNDAGPAKTNREPA